MTMNLYWTPILPPDDNNLSDQLKFALRKRFNGCVEMTMNVCSIPYLQGLSDGGIKDAQKLIAAIEKHDEIRVYEV